jgi:hypothetical protein
VEDRRCAYGDWWGNRMKRGRLEDLSIDGRHIKTGFQEVIVGGMDWIDLAQDEDSWRVLVDAVMTL